MSIWEDAPKNSWAVFEHLKILAKKMRVETYGEIAQAISEKEGREIAPISLSLPIGFIRDKICRPKDCLGLTRWRLASRTDFQEIVFCLKGWTSEMMKRSCGGER